MYVCVLKCQLPVLHVRLVGSAMLSLGHLLIVKSLMFSCDTIIVRDPILSFFPATASPCDTACPIQFRATVLGFGVPAVRGADSVAENGDVALPVALDITTVHAFRIEGHRDSAMAIHRNQTAWVAGTGP